MYFDYCQFLCECEDTNYDDTNPDDNINDNDNDDDDDNLYRSRGILITSSVAVLRIFSCFSSLSRWEQRLWNQILG